MKTPLGLATILATAAVGALLAQGPLTPPGAPAPTMKTLAQIEPRIEINADNTPGDASSLFRITAPGSYYLGGNITGGFGRHGIQIAANDVTLDLCGFQLIGVAGSLDGINVLVAENLAIHDGTLRGWGQRGLNGQSARSGVFSALRAANNGTDGMHLGTYGTVERCTARTNAGNGIVAGNNSTLDRCAAISNPGSGILLVGLSCRVTGCTVSGDLNTGIGIYATGDCVISECAVSLCGGGVGIRVGDNGIVKTSTSVSNLGAAKGILGGTACKFVDCIATGNPGVGIEAGDGSSVSGCTASNNASLGILAGASSTLSGCSASGNTTGIRTGSGSTLSGCSAYNNSQSGIDAQDGGGTAGCTLIGCTARSNGADGIQVGDGSTVSGCTSSQNGDQGIHASPGSTVSGCTVYANTLDGIFAFAGSTVSGCTARGNFGDGIEVSKTCRVVDNNSSNQQGDAGIRVTDSGNRIEGNQVSDNDIGISVDATDNLIVRNSTRSCNSPFIFIPFNHFAAGLISPGSSFVTSNPFANFLY